jgi:hypothetical protein
MLGRLVAAGALVITAGARSEAAGFAPVPTGNTVLTAPVDADHFNFIVTGDNRSTGHGYPMPPCVNEICTEIGYIHPPFVLWTGDIIEGYGDTPAEANAEYDVFVKDLALTGVPVFNAPGNHEFSLDKDLLPIYKQRIGDLYGSFDYGNSHFIALNTNAINADGTITAGTLDDTQWQWLENDLKSTSAKNIFVFLHHYPFGPPDPDSPEIDSGWKDRTSRDRFHAMMVKYGVRAVFAGHNHIYWHANKDGVDYFISGGAGAPLDASPDQGGFLHYLVVHVDGNKISTDILQPWHLSVTYPTGDGNGQSSETALVENTNHTSVTVSDIDFHINAPVVPGIAAMASVNYKGKKAKPTPANIVSQTLSADGKTETVVVEIAAKSARTTEVTVMPVAMTGNSR